MTLRLGSFLILAFSLAACGGGGGASTPSVLPSHTLVAGKFVLTIPAPSTSAAARTPKYISPSALSVSISANGQAPTIADISSGSPNCTTTGASRVCTVALQAPVGQDTFTISQYDGPNATGTLLGSGSAVTNVVAGAPFVVQAVLSGVIKTIQLALGPALTQGFPGTTTLTVSALDPDGNTIVGPGNYLVPITLSVTDPTGKTTLSTSSLTAPSATPVTVVYAGGTGMAATITASASGISPASVVFTPVVKVVYYVGNFNANSLTAYPLNANGNVSPLRTVSGNLTGFNGVFALATDNAGNLFVASALSTVGVYAARANGNVAPIRTITGSNTLIGGPASLALDTQGDLYVANCGSCIGFSGPDGVLVFAPGASGNVAPIREIAGPNTGLNGTTAVAYDGLGNIFAVSAFGASPSIVEFPATATGNVAPSGSIGGANTGLNNPLCLIFDSSGELYVCNQNNTVTVYAAGARGNVTPVREIQGPNTGLSVPDQIAIDAAGNVYVANANNNTVTVFPPSANGNQTPLYTLAGPNTGLSGSGSITLSP